jgi:hypothetical protein
MSEGLGNPGVEVVVEASAERVLLEGLRTAATEILQDSPEGSFSREIAEKMLMKAEIKERADEMQTHADDVTVYQEFKQLGVFVVRDAKAAFDFEDPESGFSLQKGDRYLDLHLPPVPEGLRSRKAVRDSLDLVKQYAEKQQLKPKYLMGVTYERLAHVANRVFGFDIAYPNPAALPNAVVAGVERVHQQFTEAGHDGESIGLPAIVFQKIESNENVKPIETKRSIGSVALGAYQHKPDRSG